MRNIEIGIVGGGQLGMLLLQSAIPFPVHVSVYDPDPTCPAGAFTKRFYQGAFEDREAILTFAKHCDVVLYETEKTNLEALYELQGQGKRVFSHPDSLEWIQDKGVQRQKLKDAGFPIPAFSLVPADQVRSYSGPFPIVQKARTGGYDGQGVFIHRDAASLAKAPEMASVFEAMVSIEKEISLLVARNEAGEIVVYPPIEMVFDQRANLVDYLVSPARIDPSLTRELTDLAQQMAHELGFVGVYAIETFVDQQGKIWINEIAPRPHNSGHHTVSANVTSQYEQQIRIALGLPMGSVDLLSPCVMLNLLGAEGESGPTNYEGLEAAYRIPQVQYVFYGKSEVRPFRKMGHAIIMDPDRDTALARMEEIRRTLTILPHE
ncbi:MAG: 5-(carboxyamino)imidazole ribonucleotide synthase [Candidatus Altimarinota bacterium]